MSTTQTPFMLLNLPVVGVEPGPTYATDNNTAFTLVDSHDHSAGKGVKITPNGINVNSDLNFNTNRASALLASAYTSQVSILGSSNTSSIYSVNGNLYWNNGSGVSIQITSGSGINIASTGTIGGDYAQPGITASVVYTNSIKTFLFTQSAGVTAKMSVSDLSISNPSSGAQAVTIKTPSGASAYDFQFATSLPASTQPISISTGGQLVYSALSATQLVQAVQDALCPTGSIMAYGASTAPSGWVICDGSSVLRAGTYANLFAIVGTSYGTADGTHFNLPDLRGYFPRGWDNGAGHDPDASSRTALNAGGATGDAIGSYQADQIASHQHHYTNYLGLAPSGSFTSPSYNGTPSNPNNDPFFGGNQTNPRNVNVNYIIKY